MTRSVFAMGDTEAAVQIAIAKPSRPEALSELGALRLKSRIEETWRERGIAPPKLEIVKVWVPAIRASVFVVQSDMKNGRPQ